MKAPAFKQKIQRTRKEILKDIIDTYKPLSKKAFSPMGDNTLAEMKELSHFMSERGHALKERFKDKTANLRMKRTDVSSKDLPIDKMKSYEIRIHESAKLLLVEFSEHSFNSFNFLNRLNQVIIILFKKERKFLFHCSKKIN